MDSHDNAWWSEQQVIWMTGDPTTTHHFRASEPPSLGSHRADTELRFRSKWHSKEISQEKSLEAEGNRIGKERKLNKIVISAGYQTHPDSAVSSGE